METKYKIGIAVAVVAVSFAAGKYTTPVKTVVQVKTVEVEKKVNDKDIDRKKKKKTVKTIITAPDGTKTETTTTDTTTDTKIDETTTTDSSKNTDSKTETTKGNNRLTVYGLLGLDFKTPAPVYGLGLYKPFIGPVGFGLQCLTSLTCSATVGIDL